MRIENSKTGARAENDLVMYYGLRASEYEAIYHRKDPVRQRDQTAIAQSIMEIFTGRRVLEVACGTGYWTQYAVNVARHVVAIDASFEMLEVARAKNMPADKVEFAKADAYQLDTITGTFDAGLANFWFSHIPKARVKEFLHGLHKKMVPGAVVFMADNVYIAGVGGKLINGADSQDTFKVRELSTGSKHFVLKNYYSEGELREILAPLVRDLKTRFGQCFWWLSYRVP